MGPRRWDRSERRSPPSRPPCRSLSTPPTGRRVDPCQRGRRNPIAACSSTTALAGRSPGWRQGHLRVWVRRCRSERCVVRGESRGCPLREGSCCSNRVRRASEVLLRPAWRPRGSSARAQYSLHPFLIGALRRSFTKMSLPRCARVVEGPVCQTSLHVRSRSAPTLNRRGESASLRRGPVQRGPLSDIRLLQTCDGSFSGRCPQ